MSKLLLLFATSAICLAQIAFADPSAITNGTDWKDTQGNPIAAHEGELSRFDGVFYWYGSSYADNPKGKFGIAVGPVWNGVLVYRSTDLIYLKESDTVMALCDQWWTPDKNDINKSRYLFLPLLLDPKTGKVTMEYREKWSPLGKGTTNEN